MLHHFDALEPVCFFSFDWASRRKWTAQEENLGWCHSRGLLWLTQETRNLVVYPLPLAGTYVWREEIKRVRKKNGNNNNRKASLGDKRWWCDARQTKRGGGIGPVANQTIQKGRENQQKEKKRRNSWRLSRMNVRSPLIFFNVWCSLAFGSAVHAGIIKS